MISPPKNSRITFTEPFYRREFSGNKLTYYIEASIEDTSTPEIVERKVVLPEQELRIVSQEQQELMDYILLVDRKLLNAIVRCDALGRFTCLRHSPQEDFFDLVKEE